MKNIVVLLSIIIIFSCIRDNDKIEDFNKDADDLSLSILSDNLILSEGELPDSIYESNEGFSFTIQTNDTLNFYDNEERSKNLNFSFVKHKLHDGIANEYRQIFPKNVYLKVEKSKYLIKLPPRNIRIRLKNKVKLGKYRLSIKAEDSSGWISKPAKLILNIEEAFPSDNQVFDKYWHLDSMIILKSTASEPQISYNYKLGDSVKTNLSFCCSPGSCSAGIYTHVTDLYLFSKYEILFRRNGHCEGDIQSKIVYNLRCLPSSSFNVNGVNGKYYFRSDSLIINSKSYMPIYIPNFAYGSYIDLHKFKIETISNHKLELTSTCDNGSINLKTRFFFNDLK